MHVVSKISYDYDCNSYLIPELKLLIDPGIHSKKLWLLENKFKQSDIETIILTHAHYDHIATAPEYENAKILGSENCVEECKNGSEKQLANLFHIEPIFFDCEIIPEKIYDLEIINTPGHSDSCICIYHKNILFSGDLFFKNTIGRPFYSEEKQFKSLKKIKKLKFKTLYPGHMDLGNKTSIKIALGFCKTHL